LENCALFSSSTLSGFFDGCVCHLLSKSDWWLFSLSIDSYCVQDHFLQIRENSSLLAFSFRSLCPLFVLFHVLSRTYFPLVQYASEMYIFEAFPGRLRLSTVLPQHHLHTALVMAFPDNWWNGRDITHPGRFSHFPSLFCPGARLGIFINNHRVNGVRVYLCYMCRSYRPGTE